MTIVELTAPSGELLGLAEVKAHLRVDGSDDDAALTALIRVARAHLERETGMALLTRLFRAYLDDWPCDGVIRIGRGPVRTIEAILVYNADGNPVEIDASGFVLDGQAHPARLVAGRNAPPAPGRPINGIEIEFTAGFGETGADVPDTLRQAMLLHVALLYEFRGAVPLEQQPAGVPAGYERLIAPFCMRRL